MINVINVYMYLLIYVNNMNISYKTLKTRQL